MSDKKIYKTIGLMSGTSLDGVDCALVETDGENHVSRLGFCFLPYPPDLQAQIRAVLNPSTGMEPAIAQAERALTQIHATAVKKILQDTGETASLIGFHGQTIHHAPDLGVTRQIGDGALLAELTGIPVITDFRSNDVRAGGQGAPLVPVYHQALAAGLEKPVTVLNLGGVGNITYIGAKGELIAFDTGPANALIDDWVLKHTGKAFDKDGQLALTGRVDKDRVAAFLSDPYFKRLPPKSLDRNHFKKYMPDTLTPADGAATLAAMTVAGVASALKHLPHAPKRWIVCGGGRLNAAIMQGLREQLGVAVDPIEKLGWNGDAIEAEAFAYLAVRSHKNMPYSFPTTTGVSAPMTGGRLYQATA